VRRIATIVPLVLVAATAFTGCSAASSSSSPTSSGASSSTSSGAAVTGSITVFAAASLTESFTTLSKAFEAANPGVTVTFSFAGSSALATQIDSGAPADVFASASAKTMDQVVSAGYAASPTTFATNIMEVAVPPANPGHVTSVQDLAKASVTTALCQPQVPCGSTAQNVFTKAKITVRPVTLEPDVKAVLGKVTLGEVDAGMVYVTDVKAAGAKVTGIAIPTGINASTSYPIAALTKSSNSATAQAFVAYVLSASGQAVLAAAGFQGP
jgi:molybdate transport system substrate-binding protein